MAPRPCRRHPGGLRRRDLGPTVPDPRPACPQGQVPRLTLSGRVSGSWALRCPRTCRPGPCSGRRGPSWAAGRRGRPPAAGCAGPGLTRSLVGPSCRPGTQGPGTCAAPRSGRRQEHFGPLGSPTGSALGCPPEASALCVQHALQEAQCSYRLGCPWAPLCSGRPGAPNASSLLALAEWTQTPHPEGLLAGAGLCAGSGALWTQSITPASLSSGEAAVGFCLGGKPKPAFSAPGSLYGVQDALCVPPGGKRDES